MFCIFSAMSPRKKKITLGKATNFVPVHVLLPEALLEQVDEFAKKSQHEMPGCTRSDAVRILLRRGLTKKETV